MKTIPLLTASLLCCLIATNALAAELKKPGPSPSDALFDPSRVIQIEIRLDPKDWHKLRVSYPVVDENGDISITEKGCEYYRAQVVIDGREVKSVGVRKKGSLGSVTSTRPALKIKFDEYVKNQEFSGLDMLTLNNCLQDPTKAQQFLVYSFMSKAGGLAPRCNLARVVVNGEDLGVYANVESIRKPFLKRFFTQANGDLYESFLGDFTTNELHQIEHKWGKDDDLSQVRKLVDVLETPGPVALKNVEELVDLDAFITFWACEVLIGHFDGYAPNRHNYYFYRDAKFGKIFFIPWGADSAFDDPGFLPESVPKSVKAAGYLCQRLWELPEIQERYREEMRRLLREVWDEKAMLSELNRIKRLCRDDRPEDPAKVKEFFDQIVQFTEGRRNEVQAELDRPAPDWPVTPRRRVGRPRWGQGPPMEVEGSFAIVAAAIPTNLFGHGSASLEFTTNGKTHKPFTRFGAAAIHKEGAEEYSLVEIVAADTGDLRWTLSFRINPYRMTPGTVEVARFAFNGRLRQGDAESPNAQGRRARGGALELTQISTNFGGTISGKFKINTTAFEEEKKP
jgi:hypothetical protein